MYSLALDPIHTYTHARGHTLWWGSEPDSHSERERTHKNKIRQSNQSNGIAGSRSENDCSNVVVSEYACVQIDKNLIHFGVVCVCVCVCIVMVFGTDFWIWILCMQTDGLYSLLSKRCSRCSDACIRSMLLDLLLLLFLLLVFYLPFTCKQFA